MKRSDLAFREENCIDIDGVNAHAGARGAPHNAQGAIAAAKVC